MYNVYFNILVLSLVTALEHKKLASYSIYHICGTFDGDFNLAA